MSSRLTAKERHDAVVASWAKLEEVKQKRERGRMAGIGAELSSPKTVPHGLEDVRPLSTQELIDLVDGTENSSKPSKQSVKKARHTTPHPPVLSHTPTTVVSAATVTSESTDSPSSKYRTTSESYQSYCGRYCIYHSN